MMIRAHSTAKFSVFLQSGNLVSSYYGLRGSVRRYHGEENVVSRVDSLVAAIGRTNEAGRKRKGEKQAGLYGKASKCN
jgi:hypothetical protein